MRDLQTPIPTDTWVTATWDEYIQLVSNPIYDKAKSYYHQGQLRIEMPPVVVRLDVNSIVQHQHSIYLLGHLLY